MFNKNLVGAFTPMDVRFKPFPEENKENQNEESKSHSELSDSVKVNADETSSVPEQHAVGAQNLDFDGLTADQKEQAIKIAATPNLALNIILIDQTPVQKCYLSILHPLYNEVKSYIEDLLN